MRSTYSIPLVGAAVLTAGAVAVGIFRSRCRPAPVSLAPGSEGMSSGALDRIREAAPSLPTDHESLLDRLRQRGF